MTYQSYVAIYNDGRRLSEGVDLALISAEISSVMTSRVALRRRSF